MIGCFDASVTTERRLYSCFVTAFKEKKKKIVARNKNEKYDSVHIVNNACRKDFQK